MIDICSIKWRAAHDNSSFTWRHGAGAGAVPAERLRQVDVTCRIGVAFRMTIAAPRT